MAYPKTRRQIYMSNWESDFRHRIDMFEASSLSRDKGITISIKIRVISGCFHREHSPNAYRIIDDYLHSYLAHDEQVSFEEHESGPELLVYLALGTAGITLAKSVIDLITAIIKARSEGIKHGDHPRDPIELIVRGFDENGKLKEEKILRIDSRDIISKELIEKTLQSSVNKMIPKNIKNKRRGT